MRDGGQGSFFTFHQVGDVEIPELGTPPLPPPPAHRTAPRTSAEAGEGLIPVIAGIRQEVLDAVRSLGSARSRIRLSAALLWLVAGSGVAYVWFRRLT